MGNRESVGIVTVLVGALLVIGAVRGTWKKLFEDVVVGGAPAPVPTPASPPVAGPDAGTGPGATTLSQSTAGANQQLLQTMQPAGNAGGPGTAVV